jgi:UDP-GlcNAc:undecaprenyl-phosphate GlcNAc-1-phosphate transferase
MWSLGLPFALALVGSWTLTHAAVHFGRRCRILDYPDNERKLHARATPRTGGLAVCGTLALGTFLQSELGAWADYPILQVTPFVRALLLSTGLLCLLGLWDDKWGMRARTKFFWQVLAILPFVLWGRSSTAVHLFGWQIDSAVVTVPLILFWLVSCTNFVNLIDGLDGLASTVALTIVLAVAVLAGMHELTDVTCLASLLAGALVGFLGHNRPPARVFLGDCGSLPLGFLVGALSLEASAKKAVGLTLAVPFVLLSIPMFDTSMAILRRKLNGRKIGQGDRAHIHHCLRDRGLSPAQTLVAIGGLCSASSAAAIFSTLLGNDLIAIGACAVLLAFLVAGRVFGFNETLLLARHLQAIASFLRGAPRALRARFVVVRLQESVAAGRLELWNKIVNRARRLPGTEVEFVCEHYPTGREIVSLSWISEPVESVEGPAWRISYAVPRSNGMCARAEARGRLAAEDGALVYHELAEMLAALCRNWPADLVGPTETVPTPDETSTDDEPQILSPHWPTARLRDRRSIPHNSITGDAA